MSPTKVSPAAKELAHTIAAYPMDKAQKDERAEVAIEAYALYLASRLGPQAAAEVLYRFADQFAVSEDRGHRL